MFLLQCLWRLSDERRLRVERCATGGGTSRRALHRLCSCCSASLAQNDGIDAESCTKSVVEGRLTAQLLSFSHLQ